MNTFEGFKVDDDNVLIIPYERTKLMYKRVREYLITKRFEGTVTFDYVIIQKDDLLRYSQVQFKNNEFNLETNRTVIMEKSNKFNEIACKFLKSSLSLLKKLSTFPRWKIIFLENNRLI